MGECAKSIASGAPSPLARTPDRRLLAALFHERVNQRPSIVARRAPRGAQMPQPGKPVSARRQFADGGSSGRRISPRVHGLAAKRKIAGVNLVRDGGVPVRMSCARCADVRRGDPSRQQRRAALRANGRPSAARAADCKTSRSRSCIFSPAESLPTPKNHALKAATRGVHGLTTLQRALN